MVLLGTVAVTTLLTAVVFVTARALWWAFKHPPRRLRGAFRPGPDAEAALRRHPAGRGRRVSAVTPRDLAGPLSAQVGAPVGPDDDPEFIDALERLIRGDGSYDDGPYPG
jgi:hypothetical protein